MQKICASNIKACPTLLTAILRSITEMSYLQTSQYLTQLLRRFSFFPWYFLESTYFAALKPSTVNSLPRKFSEYSDLLVSAKLINHPMLWVCLLE